MLARGNADRARASWCAARANYERALWLAARSGDAAAVVEAVLMGAHSLRESGQLDEAAFQYELSCILADLQNDYGRGARSENGLGITMQELGRLDDAEASYFRAAALADRANDRLTLAHVHQNLGTLENIRGHQRDAIDFYTKSLEYFRVLGDQRGLAGVLNNIAMLCIDRQEFEAAGAHLSSAFAICKEIKDTHIECVLNLTSAEYHLAKGNCGAARRHCRRALHHASALGLNRIAADALRLFGAVERSIGSLRSAERLLQRSIAMSVAASDPLTEAESWHELALVLQQHGRDKDALEALDRAHQIFSALNAMHDLADVQGRIATAEATFMKLVSAWGESIDAIDEYTRGHCRRVADFVRRLGAEIGLAERDLFWLEIGALLHDVGKTAVPAELLRKNGPLSGAERRVVQQHPQHGVTLLSGITLPGDVRSMIRSHHERWDGTGYPDGLTAGEIPLFARLLSLADVFDALTTARSYRAALPVEEAVSVMMTDIGQFDPNLIDAFLAVANPQNRNNIVRGVENLASREVLDTSGVRTLN